MDTIRIEGMPEEVHLTLVEAPNDFPLPFSAYVPDDMRTEVLETDSGSAVRFSAQFGAVLEERAYLNVFAYPPGTSEEAAAAAAEAFALSRGVPVSQGEGAEPVEPRRDFPWAVAEYAFHVPPAGDREVLGRIAVGRHGDRVFQIIRQHPPEYEEGFVPRTDLILESWVWEDTGERLVDERARRVREDEGPRPDRGR